MNKRPIPNIDYKDGRNDLREIQVCNKSRGRLEAVITTTGALIKGWNFKPEEVGAHSNK